MIKYTHLLFLFITASIFGQLNPQTKYVTKTFFPDFEEVKNVTPALKKKKGFTDYKELCEFLNELAKNHPEKVKISFIGESQKGRKIPFVKITNPNDSEKIKVFIQGGLHGNEMASPEGVLYIMHQLLNNSDYINLLEDVELAFIPMANIDGYLKEDRYAADGLDLNRDQTKLMAKESVILKQTFSDFSPEVALDIHEYTAYRKDFATLGEYGVAGIFDLMFLYTGNLNVPKNLRDITENLFVKNASNLLNENKLTNHPYITSTKYKGDIHFNQGSISARSSATNFALTNTISSLIEVRGVNLDRTSFKRRIQSMFLVAISYIKTAAEHKKEIKEEIKKAIETQKDIIVTSKRAVYEDTLKMLDLDSEKIIDLKITKRDALKSSPLLTRVTPKAYLIDKNQVDLIDKLKVLGIKVETIPEDIELEIEAYKVDFYQKNNKKYEQMNLQKVKTTLHQQKKIFPKGTYKVSLHQKNANLIVEVLEPEAASSFVSFGVLETNKDAILPIYRILN